MNEQLPKPPVPAIIEIDRIAAEIAAAVPEMARDAVLNNAVLISHKIHQGLSGYFANEIVCVYCKKSWPICPESAAAATEHIVTCDKNPLVKQINELCALVGHCWVHNGMVECGRAMMTDTQKDLFDKIASNCSTPTL
jgi:hypothetical protein